MEPSCDVVNGAARRMLAAARHLLATSQAFTVTQSVNGSSTASLAAPTVDIAAVATRLGVASSNVSATSTLQSVEATVTVVSQGAMSSDETQAALSTQAALPSALATSLGVSATKLSVVRSPLLIGPPHPPPVSSPPPPGQPSPLTLAPSQTIASPPPLQSARPPPPASPVSTIPLVNATGDQQVGSADASSGGPVVVIIIVTIVCLLVLLAILVYLLRRRGTRLTWTRRKAAEDGGHVRFIDSSHAQDITPGRQGEAWRGSRADAAKHEKNNTSVAAEDPFASSKVDVAANTAKDQKVEEPSVPAELLSRTPYDVVPDGSAPTASRSRMGSKSTPGPMSEPQAAPPAPSSQKPPSALQLAASAPRDHGKQDWLGGSSLLETSHSAESEPKPTRARPISVRKIPLTGVAAPSPTYPRSTNPRAEEARRRAELAAQRSAAQAAAYRAGLAGYDDALLDRSIDKVRGEGKAAVQAWRESRLMSDSRDTGRQFITNPMFATPGVVMPTPPQSPRSFGWPACSGAAPVVAPAAANAVRSNAAALQRARDANTSLTIDGDLPVGLTAEEAQMLLFLWNDHDEDARV